MLNQNTTRIDFAVRLQQIIDRYNAKTSDVNAFFEELKAYMAKLRQEDLRAQSEDLTEEELQIFDLLYKDKLTKAEKQQVKLASKDLLQKLQQEKDKVLVEDWHKHQRPRINVERYVRKLLYQQLKDIYPTEEFREQADKVFGFMREQAEMRGRAQA